MLEGGEIDHQLCSRSEARPFFDPRDPACVRVRRWVKKGREGQKKLGQGV